MPDDAPNTAAWMAAVAAIRDLTPKQIDRVRMIVIPEVLREKRGVRPAGAAGTNVVSGKE